MPYGEKSAYEAQAKLKGQSPAYKKSSGFKMKSPLKEGVSGHSDVDESHWKKIHKDPLVHQLSRQPELMGLTTRQLKKRAKIMRG